MPLGTPSQRNYTYSTPAKVREWPGGFISVQVGYVKNHPEQNTIVLLKEWAGKGVTSSQRFNIKSGDDWIAIRTAVESLWPEIGEVPSPSDIEDAIAKVSSETDLLQLITRYPALLKSLPDDVDIFALPPEQREALTRFLATGGEVAAQVIDRLARQPVRDLEDFVAILTQLRLSTINSLVNHVRSRLAFIDKFEQAIHDNTSYERRGSGSIHNLLKANIWMLDRNYSVLHDDETLRNIILAEWDKSIGKTEVGAKRPDFLCMANRPRSEGAKRDIVVVEIKRPSVTLNMAHVGQLMQYRTTLEHYSGSSIGLFKSYLVGREVDEILKANDLSSSGYTIKTYTDFIVDARDFYREYLEIVERDQFAI